MTGSPAGHGVEPVCTSEGVRRRQAHAPGSWRTLAFVSRGDQAIIMMISTTLRPSEIHAADHLPDLELGPCAALAAHRWDPLEDRAAAW